MLHTKSQAGRTQKSGPPATRFERHLLRRTVKLRTACERGRTGKNRERRQNTAARRQSQGLRETLGGTQRIALPGKGPTRAGGDGPQAPPPAQGGQGQIVPLPAGGLILPRAHLPPWGLCTVAKAPSSLPMFSHTRFHPDTQLLSILVLMGLEALSCTGMF